MNTTKPTRTTPRDMARILFRHWRKMAAVFCGALLLTLLATALYPRSYYSEAKIVIRVGRESVALDPTATTGQTIMLQKTQEDEVNLAMDILSSHEVLHRVVDAVGAKRILDKLKTTGAPAVSTSSTASAPVATESTVNWLDSILSGLRLSEVSSDSDLAIRRLNSRIRISAPKQSTIITIGYSAASPELAHDVVDAVTNVFLEEHLRLNQADGSLEFFAEQADKLHEELITKQAELRDRKNAFKLTSANSRPSMLERADDALRAKLFELETQESDLKSRYTDDYPPLKELRRQRAETEAALTAVPEGLTKSSAGAPGPGRLVASTSQDGKLYAELQSLNDQELQLAQLERDVQLLDGKYRMHVEKLEQARVNEAMGKERITNVKIAQPATFVAKAAWPNKRLLLSLGLAVAVCGAFGGALLAEGMDQTLRTVDQVETQLGLPVLLSIPYRKRRKQSLAPANAPVVKSNGLSLHDGRQSAGRYGALLRELMPANGNEIGDEHRHAKSVGVIGCDTSKLRSRVAAELAIRASRSSSEPVLLIDADSRHRRVAKRFHLNGSPGWHDVLAGTADAESCIHQSQSDNLAVMTAGGEDGESPATKIATIPQQQLEDIKTDYGLIVVDLPPIREMEAPSAAAEWLDEVVLVVEAERTRIHTAQHAKEVLRRAGVNVTGVVLANRREHIPQWLYQRL
jgi:polysaccharide biosynthesis transport protein